MKSLHYFVAGVIFSHTLVHLRCNFFQKDLSSKAETCHGGVWSFNSDAVALTETALTPNLLILRTTILSNENINTILETFQPQGVLNFLESNAIDPILSSHFISEILKFYFVTNKNGIGT